MNSPHQGSATTTGVAEPFATRAYPQPTAPAPIGVKKSHKPNKASTTGAPPKAAEPPVATCTLHREDLDQYLSISGYGSNVAMFNCYFVRDGPNTPPLCIACRRLIGDHSSQAVSMMTVGSPHLAVPVPGQATARPPPPPPSCMTIGDNIDVARPPGSRQSYYTIAGAFFFFVLVLVLVVVIADVPRTPFVMAIPFGVLALIIFGCAFAKWTVVTFHKELGLGPHSRVDVTLRRFTGCTHTRNSTVGELGPVVCRSTLGTVNHKTIYEVVALASTGEATLLFSGYHDECAPELAAWQAYFMQYGTFSQAGMPSIFV